MNPSYGCESLGPRVFHGASLLINRLTGGLPTCCVPILKIKRWRVLLTGRENVLDQKPRFVCVVNLGKWLAFSPIRNEEIEQHGFLRPLQPRNAPSITQLVLGKSLVSREPLPSDAWPHSGHDRVPPPAHPGHPAGNPSNTGTCVLKQVPGCSLNWEPHGVAALPKTAGMLAIAECFCLRSRTKFSWLQRWFLILFFPHYKYKNMLLLFSSLKSI